VKETIRYTANGAAKLEYSRMMKPNLRENPLQFLSLTFQLEQPFLGYELGTLPANQKVLISGGPFVSVKFVGGTIFCRLKTKFSVILAM